MENEKIDVTKNYMVQKDRAFRIFDKEYIERFKNLEGTYWRCIDKSRWQTIERIYYIEKIEGINSIDDIWNHVKMKFLEHEFKVDEGYDTNFFYELLKDNDVINGMIFSCDGRMVSYCATSTTYEHLELSKDVDETVSFSNNIIYGLIKFVDDNKQITKEEFEKRYNEFVEQVKLKD